MIKEYPFISIITPNFNCEKIISETIESVIAQTYQNWELLIQDDCSKDGSYEIALEYAQRDNRIKVEQNNQNSGAAITRNNAIKRSVGEYLAFLDSDDLWVPEKLEKQLQFMQENDCDFSFTRYEHIDENGNSLNIRARIVKKLTYTKMLMHCWPGCLTVMYKQDISNKIYADDIKKNNDHALFLRVLRTCYNAMGINENLAYYRIRKGSISRNSVSVLKYFIKVIHEFEGKSILFAYWCAFTHVIIKKFFKYERIK
jgi:teichuronic acid biosynthesis glycosyltransferase TuaG